MMEKKIKKHFTRDDIHLLSPATTDDLKAGQKLYVDNSVNPLFKDIYRNRYKYETQQQYDTYVNYHKSKIKEGRLFIETEK